MVLLPISISSSDRLNCLLPCSTLPPRKQNKLFDTRLNQYDQQPIFARPPYITRALAWQPYHNLPCSTLSERVSPRVWTKHITTPLFQDGRLKPGDQILVVGGISTSDITQEQAAKLIDSDSDYVRITVAKMAAAYYGIFSEEGTIYLVQSVNTLFGLCMRHQPWQLSRWQPR